MQKELIDYIQDSLAKGFSEAQVKAGLRQTGYTEEAVEEAFSFLPPESHGYYWKLGKALFSPTRLFEYVQQERGIGKPLIFLFLNSVISGLLASIVLILALQLFMNKFPMLAIFDGEPVLLLAPILIMLIVIVLFFASFIAAGILHVSAVLLHGQGRFEASYKVVAYSTAVMIPAVFISLIPIVGQLITGIWSLVITIIGISILHNVTKFRALIVILLPNIIIGLATFASLYLLILLGPPPGSIERETQVVQTVQCTQKNGQWCVASTYGETCTDSKDGCIGIQAAQQKDISLCETVADFQEKENCYGNVAVSKQDVSFCNKTTDDDRKNNCVGSVAAVLNKPELCEQAPNKDDCYISYVMSNPDQAVCQRVSEETRSQCEFFTTPPPPPSDSTGA